MLYWAKISGERLQDHWSSGYYIRCKLGVTLYGELPWWGLGPIIKISCDVIDLFYDETHIQ